MFAKWIFTGSRRGARLAVLALFATLAMQVAAQAQNASTTATVTPPSGVTNSGTQCVSPAVFTPATGACASTDDDPVTRWSDLTIVKTEREGSSTAFIAGPLTVDVGATVEFRIVVGNAGPSAIGNATFTDIVPADITGLSIISTVASVAPAVATACTAGLLGNALKGVFSGPEGSSCSVIIRGTASIAAAAPGVTSTATAVPPEGTIDPDGASSSVQTIIIAPAPSLRLTKTGVLSADKKAVSYGFLVENTGNVDLTDVTVGDSKLPSLSCRAIALAARTSQTLSCSSNLYTVSAADYAAAKVDNVATASGMTPTGAAVSATDSETVLVRGQPALSLDKVGTLAADQTTISYAFTVSNTGNVDLTNVTLVDPMLSALDCTSITMAAGATQALACVNSNHAATVAEFASGSVINTATVTATPAGGSVLVTAGDTEITPLLSSVEPLDDAGTTEQNTAVTVDVQVNDISKGARLDPQSVTILTNPSNGTVSVNPDGTIAYTPATNYSGVDSFVYQICNAASPTPACKPAAVAITITPNRVYAVDDNVRTPLATPVTLDLIGNDSTSKLPLDPASVAVSTPASHGIVSCGSGSCVYTPNPSHVGEDSFVYRVCDVSLPIPVCDTATVTITVEGNTKVRVSKQARPRDVKVGELVRYTVSMENVGETDVIDATVVDTPPPGFTLVGGSLQVDDRDGAGRLAGSYPIRVDQIDIAKGERAAMSYLLRVGAGVRGVVHTNAAEVHDNGVRVSNVATASVQMVSDPMTDEATVLGTVFDDRDGDGWQDSAEMSEVHVKGGFAPAAYISSSTTVDYGGGPQAQADGSSSLLHGIAIGRIAGRQSDADPAQARQVVVSQLLRSLNFSNDFELRTAQGATLRLDAAGNTQLSVDRGAIGKGQSAAWPTVERRVSPAEVGYRVDYIIRNQGVDERGIPGVRIASVDGLLVETDQYGRYSLIGVDAGRDDRGRNFILKVDPATLPPGSVFITSNPLLRRVTNGLAVRFDFGITLPPGLLKGESEQTVEMELGDVMFAPASAELRSQYLPAVENMAAQLRSHGGGEVVIGAHGENELLAFDRAVAVRKALVAALPAQMAARTTVSLRTRGGEDRDRVVELRSWPVLGSVLFDTDKASIKPHYAALLSHIANYLLEMDVPTIKLVGHADHRASDAYNDALGMRRAKAVFDAISALMPPAQRSRVNVEIMPGEPDASSSQPVKELTP